MKKKISIIIAVIVIIALIAAAAIFHYLSNRTHFNEGYVNGNTAGNLYNGGLFCEYDGTVYFSNPSDGGKLYSMSPDGSNLAKLCDDTVSYINADEHYLYYVRNNPGATGAALSFLSVNTDSLCRIDREGGDDSVLILDSAPCLYASLYGNYIYYIRYDESEGSTLYKVKIDGSGCKQVDTAPDFTCSANGEYMYYNGTDSDHYIWRLNTTDDSKGMLYGGNCYMPTVIDDTTAYFMDCDSNYAIARTDLATGEKTLLSEDRVDWYNLYGDYIYFQKNESEHPCLGFMRTDGSGYTTLFEGNFKDITITSEYVYFRDFSTDQSYCVPLGSSASPVAFDPGVVED